MQRDVFDDGIREAGAFPSGLLPDEVQRRLAYYPLALDAALYAWRNMGAGVRLDEVAARAEMSPAAFSRYFVEKVGITFASLLKALRIEHALNQIDVRGSAIAGLAELIGYRNGPAA